MVKMKIRIGLVVGNQIDDAFNWLVLILSTISGVLTGLPETMEVKKVVALGLIPPLLVLVVVWLFSHLTERTSLQIILKSFAWFYSSFMFLAFVFIFVYVTSPAFISLLFGPAGLAQTFRVVLYVMVVSYLVTPFLFYAVAIQPKYRQIHKDSRFLASRIQPALLYILAFVTYLVLFMPLVTVILGLLSPLSSF